MRHLFYTNYDARNCLCKKVQACRANYDALILRKILRAQYFASYICEKDKACRANYDALILRKLLHAQYFHMTVGKHIAIFIHYTNIEA
jgi:hypothetical protein